MVLRKKYISGMSDMSLTKKEVMPSKDLLDRGNCVLLPEIEKVVNENRFTMIRNDLDKAFSDLSQNCDEIEFGDLWEGTTNNDIESDVHLLEGNFMPNVDDFKQMLPSTYSSIISTKTNLEISMTTHIVTLGATSTEVLLSDICPDDQFNLECETEIVYPKYCNVIENKVDNSNFIETTLPLPLLKTIKKCVRMRGGADDVANTLEIVAKCKCSARRHDIELVHGRENEAKGNCAIDSSVFNIADRKEFTADQKVTMHPKEARQVWVTELQTVIESDYPDIIPDNIPNFNAEECWNELKQDRVYEIPLIGDLLIHAISRGSKKVILIFNTSTQANDPIYVVEPERFGGVRDSDIPIVLAYNQSHYESMHPKSPEDVQKTIELIRQYINGDYPYSKKDIDYLTTPFSTNNDDIPSPVSSLFSVHSPDTIAKDVSPSLVSTSCSVPVQDQTSQNKNKKESAADRKRRYRKSNPEKYMIAKKRTALLQQEKRKTNPEKYKVEKNVITKQRIVSHKKKSRKV